MKLDSVSFGSAIGNSAINNAEVSKDIDKAQKFADALEKASKQKEKDEKELLKSCQELESVFLNQILNAMRATIPKSDLMGNSFATDVWESMLYEEYSKQMSKSQTTGLAEILFKQLNQNTK